MKVLATILVVLTSVAGFVLSYEFAYKKIVNMMHANDQRTEAPFNQTR